MTRPLGTTFIPIPWLTLTSTQPIREGSGGGFYGEQDLIENIHWCQAKITPQCILTCFNSDNGYLEGGAGVYTIRATWKRRIFDDFARWRCVAYVSNTDGANAGKIRFSIASSGATSGDITVAAGATAWTRVTGTVLVDTATARNVIRLELENPAAGVVRVRSVQIWPEPLGTIAAGVTTEGFVPHDTEETSQDDPLTVALRQAEISNLDILRRTRMDTIVGWSEDNGRATSQAYSATSATYATVAEVPFRSLPGQDAIEFEVLGFRAGASGGVRLRTGYMVQHGIAAVEVAFGAGPWASPYTTFWTGDGGSTLTCAPNTEDYIIVDLKGDGASAAHLFGLVAWFKDID